MAFIVETGLIVAGANAYIPVAFADSYHDERGHLAWESLSNDQKQQCIIRATDYIDKRFCRKFRGTARVHRDALYWPRIGVFDNDGYLIAASNVIPRQLQQACAEYALRAAVYSELLPDPLLTVPTQDFTQGALPTIATEPGPGAVAQKLERVDIVEEEISFASPSRTSLVPGKNITSGIVSSGNIPEYPAADLLLEELLNMGRRKLARG